MLTSMLLSFLLLQCSVQIFLLYENLFVMLFISCYGHDKVEPGPVLKAKVSWFYFL